MRSNSLAGASVAQRCPVCGKPVQADTTGFVECPCGWGGPGDPVESARGLSRTVTLLDRRWASSIARRDLARIAARKGPSSPRGLFYMLALLALSTLIYTALAVLVAGSVSLLVYYALHGFWVGVVLIGAVPLYLYGVLFGFPTRSRATTLARLADYPRLEALTREVAAEVGVAPPRWVVIFPGANFFIGRRMLWGKALLPQSVLGVGVAGLTLLSERELRAILAHELAHDRYAHTLSASYFGRAESALHGVISAAHQGMNTNTRGARRVFKANNAPANLGVALGVIVVWIVTLPLRLLWIIFHLLRLRISRANEFQADATAIRLYGTETYINAQTGVLAVAATMRGATQGIRQEMARSDTPNFFAALRRHYDELPQDYLGEMRLKSAREYRTLQRTHPIMPDRIRAALIEAVTPPPADPSGPAWMVLATSGETLTSAIEMDMTRRLFR